MRLDPQNILIVLHGSIGDVTRALPLANLIRRGFPRATLAWSVEPAALPLVERHPAVDEALVFDRAHWWRALVPFIRKIRSRRFDLVLDLQRHLKSGVISRFSGAPYRLGFHRQDCKEFNWIFNNHHIETTGAAVSKLNHYLKFAEHFGIDAEPVEWKVELTGEERASVDRLLVDVRADFAVLFAGSRWESKRWFPDQMAACASEIQRRQGLDVVFLGGNEDGVQGQSAEELCGGRVVNLVGRTTLRQAIGVLQKAKFAVGPDTGLMHIAAAVGTPVVSLWGATSPLRTGPYGFGDLAIQGAVACSPCYLRRCPIGRICMRSIDVERISEKTATALSWGGEHGQSYEISI